MIGEQHMFTWKKLTLRADLLEIGMLLIMLLPGCASPPVPVYPEPKTHTEPGNINVYGHNAIKPPVNASLPSGSH